MRCGKSSAFHYTRSPTVNKERDGHRGWQGAETDAQGRRAGGRCLHRDGVARAQPQGESHFRGHRQSDFGHNFYAGQTLAHDARVTLFAWMGDFSHPIETQESGWSGQLALPRDLGLNAELELTTTPILELAQLRGASHELGTVPLQAGGHPPHLRCAGC
nr:hypothetical protein [Corynebacterium pyruviciproducens]